MNINCEKINKEVGIGVKTPAEAIKHARAKINYLYRDNKNLNSMQWQAVLELQSIIKSIELNEQPTKAEDILQYWEKYDYIINEYTSSKGNKCYRTYGWQPYFAAMCAKFGLNFEFLDGYNCIVKGDGFTLKYSDGKVFLEIENNENGGKK